VHAAAVSSAGILLSAKRSIELILVAPGEEDKQYLCALAHHTRTLSLYCYLVLLGKYLARQDLRVRCIRVIWLRRLVESTSDQMTTATHPRPFLRIRRRDGWMNGLADRQTDRQTGQQMTRQVEIRGMS
jgi:hypothetical protein